MHGRGRARPGHEPRVEKYTYFVDRAYEVHTSRLKAAICSYQYGAPETPTMSSPRIMSLGLALSPKMTEFVIPDHAFCHGC